jgi:hypothetical protein
MHDPLLAYKQNTNGLGVVPSPFDELLNLDC